MGLKKLKLKKKPSKLLRTKVKKSLAFHYWHFTIIAIVKSQALLVYVDQLDGSRYIVG